MGELRLLGGLLEQPRHVAVVATLACGFVTGGSPQLDHAITDGILEGLLVCFFDVLRHELEFNVVAIRANDERIFDVGEIVARLVVDFGLAVCP